MSFDQPHDPRSVSHGSYRSHKSYRTYGSYRALSPHDQVQRNCRYKDDTNERVALEERLIDPVQVELGRRPMLIKQGATDQQQRTKINPAKSADIAEADEAKEQDAVHNMGFPRVSASPRSCTASCSFASSASAMSADLAGFILVRCCWSVAPCFMSIGRRPSST